MEAAQERRVDVFPAVAGEDGDPTEILQSLKQIVDLDIRVTVVSVLHFGALAKERVGFIKEKNGAGLLRAVENPGEVLFRFADVFAQDTCQIDSDEVKAEFLSKKA